MSVQHKQQEKEAERKGTRSRTAQHEIRYVSRFNPVQAYSPACHLNHLAFLVAVIPMYNVSYAT